MNIRKTAFLTAVISVFFALGGLSAGAANFSEDEKGVKTWTFQVNEGYTDDRADFVNGTTYYVSNNYTTAKPDDLSDYLTLSVNNDEKTIESKDNDALYLWSGGNVTSSTLSWTVTEDGTISITSKGDLELYVNDTHILTCNWTEETGGETKTTDVKKGDIIKVVAKKYGGIFKLIFTPDTYDTAYQFTKSASELKNGTLKVKSSEGEKSIAMDSILTTFTGNFDVVFGLIIENVPNSVDITGAEIVCE